MHKKILVIEDKPSQLRLAEFSLGYKLMYHSVGTASSETNFSQSLASLQYHPDLVLIDLAANAPNYLKVIRDLKAYKPVWPIVVLINYGEDEIAMQAIATGASDFISKPVTLERLNLTIQNVLRIQNMGQVIARLERKNKGQVALSDIIAGSPLMKAVLLKAEMATSSDMPVWIEGEDGTGKEFTARAIHAGSIRKGKPFNVLECSQMPNSKVEISAAGQGALMAATQFLYSKLHEANHGTLLLRDVNLLPHSFQQRLWDILEAGSIPTCESHGAEPLRIRFICTSNKPVDAMIAEGSFSLLHKRLHSILVSIPALRNRKEDIAPLARQLVSMYAASENKLISDISTDAMKLLEGSPWPGNAIQLERMLQRAVLLCNHSELDVGTLRLIQQLEPVNFTSSNDQHSAAAPTLLDIQGRLKKLKFIEEEAIRFALVNSGGSMTRAARNLGIGRSTLYRKVSGMTPDIYISRENQTTRPMMSASEVERS